MRTFSLGCAALLSLCCAAASAEPTTLAAEDARCAGLHDAGVASSIKVGIAPKPDFAEQKRAAWFELALKADPTISKDDFYRIEIAAAHQYRPVSDMFFQGVAAKNADWKFNSALALWGKFSDHCDSVKSEIDSLVK